MPPATRPALLPLRFTPPADWPRPGSDWSAAHQGWDMPRGWRPGPSLQPAPDEWTWWQRDDDGWVATVAPRRAELRRSMLLSTLLLLLAVVVLVLHGDSWVAVPAWGAVVGAPLMLARQFGAYRRIDSTVVADARRRALEIRRSRAFFSYVGDTGLASVFAEPPRLHPSGRRIATLGMATLAGTGLAVVIAASVIGHESGSGAAQASVVETDGRSAVSVAGPAARDVTAKTETDTASGSATPSAMASFLADGQSTAAHCGTRSCWIVRVVAEPACTRALVVVEFSDAVGVAPSRHVLLRLPVAGSTPADVAADAETPAEHYADVAEARCVERG